MAQIVTSKGVLTGHKVTVERSTSNVFVPNACLFAGIMVKPGKSGNSYLPVTIIGIYNSNQTSQNTNANRRVPRNLEIPAGTQPLYTLSIDPPLLCSNGIAVELSGAGDPRVQVIYDDKEDE